ncbi:protein MICRORCHIDIA 6-like isoform X2 [Cicer arietinum]|uniref:Protein MICRORCHIDIA 6-like isoform X2 n=1 Tax=Cicer arietinum TaxID=3827 RepID=A0A3Q7YFE8_CICAR|nr:protein MICRORCHIDIA 6-like isoform X2 [Cicer arietinum]
MGIVDIIDLSSDDESESVGVGPVAVKLEPEYVTSAEKQHVTGKFGLVKHEKSPYHVTRQDADENISYSAPSTGHSNSSVLEQGPSPVDDTGISYASSICAAPLSRQFWKAGSYDDAVGSRITVKDGKNYLHVHPMFLHSNATSHKWAFGAIAELLDNAVDEIQNGATFVIVDKTSNPRDGSSALLIQDDGGGMDPEAIRRCMSFGFSDKNSKHAIGQYGNGFKTSSMRLGADAIVFSRHMNNGILTQSIGLLSYTFLMRTQLDRIVVPMVNYEFNTSTGSLDMLNGKEHFMANLSLLLRWSPYSSEADLLKQFDNMGSHGTKVIVYNLWFGDDGNTELDFDTEPKDIRIAWDIKKVETRPAWKRINEDHIANRFRYSLRVYLSILYLQLPKSFQIILRGQAVKPHSIADDLKLVEFVKYTPQTGGTVEEIFVTIGFVKEAPLLNIHGFNVYHKHRLILVVRYSDSRGRGVVGIMQADFVEPTHDKQDFEKTSLFQKLEARLKSMTWEYWDTHCKLIGYRPQDKPRTLVTQPHPSLRQPLEYHKRKTDELIGLQKRKKHAREDYVTGNGFSQNKQITTTPADQVVNQEAIQLMQENKKLHTKCLEFEKRREELNFMATKLRSKIEEARHQYNRLLDELQSLEVKEE